MRTALALAVGVITAACSGGPPPGTTAATLSDVPPRSGPPIAPGTSLDPDSPYRTTRDAFLLATKACVEDLGFSVELDVRQGGFRFDLGDETRTAEADQALRECVGQVDSRRLQPPPRLTREDLVAWYAYKVRIASCLTAGGAVVPDPPPKSVFIDTNGEWDPFAAAAGAGRSVPADLQSGCEQVDGAPGFLGW